MKRLLLLSLLIPFSLSAMEQNSEKGQEMFNLNVDASLVDGSDTTLCTHHLNFSTYFNKELGKPYVIEQHDSQSSPATGSPYETLLEARSVFLGSSGQELITLLCTVSKTVHGKTKIIKADQAVQFAIQGIRETTHRQLVHRCDVYPTQELTLKITSKRALSALEQRAEAQLDQRVTARMQARGIPEHLRFLLDEETYEFFE